MAPDPTPTPVSPHAARQRWMAILARASATEVANLLETAPALPDFVALRGPEQGLVMVRGRAGGAGAAFNLGEASVTRCTVRDAQGRIGHAYVRGRDARLTELAARLDAVLQDPLLHPQFDAAVIAPLAAAQAARTAEAARKAAATRVQFFTLATMRST
jgi:alpha-D-ribose 1-methylphosphonate 5-triphosphate synthase subunit PhnG